ncbi:MAG: KdsC family phosphatase [Leptospirales bacterium]
MRQGLSAGVLRKLRAVRGVVLDIDGILGDGQVLYGSEEDWKGFHIRDGHGLVLLRRLGLPVGVISGRNSQGTRRRLDELEIRERYLGIREKMPSFLQLLDNWDLRADEILYMGDDVVDLPPMRMAGLAVTVPEAPMAIRRISDWVTRSHGGRGAIREVTDWLCFTKTGDTSFQFENLPRGQS